MILCSYTTINFNLKLTDKENYDFYIYVVSFSHIILN